MADIQKVSLKEQLEKNLEHLGKMETPVLLSAIQVQKQVRHTVSSWTWKVYTAIIFMTVFGVLIPNSYYINEEWQRAVETRAGEFIRVTGPGLRLKLPFIEKYQQYRIDLQQIQVNQVKVKTKNEKNRKKGYEFEANILLLYRLPEDQVKYIHSKYYDFKKKLEEIIQKRFRIEISQIKMADIPKMRNSLAKKILKEIKQEIKDIKLQLELYDFGILYYSWSEEFRRDIRKADYKKEQMIADKKKQQNQYIEEKYNIEDQIKVERAEADGKIQNIKAQRNAYLKTSTAEIEAQIEKMTADAKAHTIHLIGEAKAAALQAQAQIMATHQGLIELEKIKRWDGKLPDCDNIQEIFPFINQIGTSQTSTNTFIIIPLQKPSVVKE